MYFLSYTEQMFTKFKSGVITSETNERRSQGTLIETKSKINSVENNLHYCKQKFSFGNSKDYFPSC